MKRLFLAFCIGVALSIGCASSPKKIGATYVSPLKYKDYDCDQIALEMDQITNRTNVLYHSLKKDANNDKWQMGVGLILFWPTLFLVEGGDGPEATEYAQLKGEYEALRQVAVEKKCALETLPPSPEEVIKQQDQKRQEKKEDKGEKANEQQAQTGGATQ